MKISPIFKSTALTREIIQTVYKLVIRLSFEVEKIDARFAPQEKKDEIIARAKSKVLPNPEVMSQQESMWK